MSDANGDHDHDHEEEDSEIAITFHPREEDLSKLGVSLELFETALLDALDRHEALDPEDAPAFEEIELELAGQKVRLGDIADVEMSATLGEIDEDEEEEDWSEEEFEDEDDDEEDDEDE